MTSAMKGIINLEFLIALVVFISIISFVALQIIGIIPIMHQESIMQSGRSNSYLISEMLVFDEGNPINWDTKNDIDDIKSIGLRKSSDKFYELDKNKLDKLQSLCSGKDGKQKIREMFGEDVNITISTINKDPPFVSSCTTTTSAGSGRFTTRRSGFYMSPGKNELIKIDIAVIK